MACFDCTIHSVPTDLKYSLRSRRRKGTRLSQIQTYSFHSLTDALIKITFVND